MNMTPEQLTEWTAYLNGPTDATPPAFALIAHWQEVTAKGDPAPAWGNDRSVAILAELDRLHAELADRDAQIGSLRETIAFNRRQAARRGRQNVSV